jgi:hypothetical protein
MIPKKTFLLFTTLITILTAGLLAACGAISAQPPATATPTCQPSPIQTSKTGFHEIRGNMATDGELWALLFFEKPHAQTVLKIAWRMSGVGGDFSISFLARHPDGTVIAPTWGPEFHGGSNWERPGDEWGTGFNFPKPGCWTIIATRGTIKGEIRLDVLAP